MAGPQTANFGPEATQLSAPQGAGANPLEGVKEPASGIDLSPVMNLVQGADSMFTDMLKKKKETNENQVISDFVKAHEKNDQMRLQTGDRSRWMAQQQLINSQFAGQYGDMVDKLQKVVNFRKGGLVEEQETEAQVQEKIRVRDLEEISRWADVRGVSRDTENSLRETLRVTNRLKQQQEEERATQQYRASLSAEERAAYEFGQKKEGTQLVTQLAATHETSFTNYVFEMARKVSEGMDEKEANQRVLQYYNQIQLSLSSASSANPQLAAPFKASFENIYNIGRDYLKPGSKLRDLEDQVKLIRMQGQLKFLNRDPNIPEMVAASEFFKNHPDILLKADSAIVKAVGSWGLQETGVNTPGVQEGSRTQIIGVPQYEKPAFDTLKSAIKQSVDGTRGDRTKLNTEVYGQMKGLFSQYSDQYLLQRLTPETRKNMNELLMDKTVAKFIRDNPIPVQVAQSMLSVVKDNFKQYRSTVSNALSDVLQGSYKKEPNPKDLMATPSVLGGGVENFDVPDLRRNPDVDPLNAINITWKGDQMVFSAVKMPVDPAQQALLVSKMNNLSKVLSNGVIIGAHIEGSTDYEGYFNRNKHLMFEGKFPVPAAEQQGPAVAPKAPAGVKRSAAEEKMAQQAVIEPSAPDANTAERLRYDINSIRKEMKKHKLGSKEYNVLDQELDRLLEITNAR